MNTYLKYHPMVAPVEGEYQILFMTAVPGIGWIEVDGTRYTDEECGILHYGDMHKIRVDRAALDRAGQYTLVFVEYKEKPAYNAVGEEVIREKYRFCPLQGENLHLFQFADTHGHIEVPLENFRRYEETYGRVDLLVLNGDITSASDTVKQMELSFALASEAAAGERPVIYARGNHDTRGRAAQLLAEYSPNAFRNGRKETFWSFRQGGLWGVVLDCGEDKFDNHREYGGTVAFEPFREREADWLRSPIENKSEEYEAPGVTHRIAFCHIPFVEYFDGDFSVSAQTYDRWVQMLGEMGIDLLLCGHMHTSYFLPPHAENKRDAAFPTAVSSRPPREKDEKPFYVGAAVEIRDGRRTVYAVVDGKRDASMVF